MCGALGLGRIPGQWPGREESAKRWDKQGGCVGYWGEGVVGWRASERGRGRGDGKPGQTAYKENPGGGGQSHGRECASAGCVARHELTPAWAWSVGVIVPRG